MALGIHRHQVRQFQRRFAEQMGAALVFQHQQTALNGADGGGGDVAITQRNLVVVLANPDQQRLQVFQIQERQPLFIRQAKGDVHHAFLRFGQLQQTAQQQRPHFSHRGADRVALFAKQVPEDHRSGVIAEIRHADGGDPLHEGVVQFEAFRPGHRQPGQIAFDIGQKHRHARQRKPLGKPLQGHGFTGSGRPRDQPVAVAEPQQQGLRQTIAFATATHENRVALRHTASFPFGFADLRSQRSWLKYIFNPCLPV